VRRSIALALAWGGGFFVGGVAGIVSAITLAQLANGLLAALGGERVALLLGWGVGCAFGGLIASSAGMAAQHKILGA
jgi:hypothetical protein